MNKKIKPIKVNEEGIVKDSKTRDEFLKFIEKYKLENPVRYERVKDELEKKLSTL